MKKAVITIAGLQYIVHEGETLNVNRLDAEVKNLSFDPMLVIDDKKVSIGTPLVSGIKVTAEIIDEAARGVKVTAIRFKAKKRVTTVRGHRQSLTTIKINTIA